MEPSSTECQMSLDALELPPLAWSLGRIAVGANRSDRVTSTCVEPSTTFSSWDSSDYRVTSTCVEPRLSKMSVFFHFKSIFHSKISLISK